MGMPMMCLLDDLFKAIEAGRKRKFKQTIQSLQPFLKSLDTNFTAEFEGNPFKDTNLVILCCKFGQMDILDYILSRPNDKQFIECFFNGKIAKLSSPLDGDGEGHDAFYYAIRSNNIEVVKLLLMKWLQSFESVAYSKDFLLSQAYEKLKLRNVRLTEEMEFFVESEIIASRFILKEEEMKYSRMDLLERIDWFLSNIDSLGKVEAESTFLVLAKCVAQNMNILKRQLKATYETLPWEELEFCLISYIIPKVHPQENSILPLVAITKETLLSQLGYFASILRRLRENDLLGLNEFPNMSREEAESKIKKNSEEFTSLYEIYKKTRDMYSLQKIYEYLKLSLSANHKQKQGQLSILRVLQIISDYQKNTLDNCKLSAATSRVILSALPVKTRNIVIELRNTVCLGHSLKKRLEIEENNPQFFRDVQTDLRRLSQVVDRIMRNEKLKITVDLFKKISKTDNVAEVREIGKSINSIQKCIEGENFKLFEEKKIRKLINELRKSIPKPGMSFREVSLFDDVMNDLAEDRPFDVPLLALEVLGTIALHCFKRFKSFDRKLDAGDLVLIRSTAAVALRGLTPAASIEKMSKVLEFVKDINKAIKGKSYCFNFLESDVQKMNMILFDISFAATMNVEDVLCLDVTQNSSDLKENSKPFLSETERNTYFNSKLTILNSIIGNEVSRANFLNQNEKVKLATELLLLDILTITNGDNCEPENSVLYIEDYAPVVVGKCLRNYLAHGSALLEIFPTDPTTSIQLNAFLLLKDEILTDCRKNRKVLSDDVLKAKEKFTKNMEIVIDQDQLFHALEKGDSETSRAMIKSGADLFGRSIYHESSLHFAVRGPNFDIGKFIVEQKVEVNSVDKEGRSALHIAAAHGNVAMVKHLIENGVDMEQKENNGRTPLHEAAKHGSVETVALLIKLGADVRALTNKNTTLLLIIPNNMGVEILLERSPRLFGCAPIGQLTPLHVAAEHNRVDVIKLMLKKGVHVDILNPFNATPLIAAAESGSAEAAAILIKAGAKVNTYFDRIFTALHLAADIGHAGVAAILLQNGADADPSKNPCKPIHFAAGNGRSEVVELLIRHKANLESINEGCAPLHLAAQCGHVEVVRALIGAGVSVLSRDERGITALHYSASNGSLEVAKFLIEKGAEVNAKGPFESTALHLAAEAGYEEIGEILVKSGAKVDAIRGVDGCTPLIIAMRKNANSLFVKLLLENGANPALKDKREMAPVHVGSTEGNVDGISYLMKFKCNVNQRGVRGIGVIPLHIAAGVGNCKVAELLLNNGADVNSICQEYFTPLYTAVVNDHLNMVRLLLRYGAGENLGVACPALKAIDNNSNDVLECLFRQKAYISRDDTLLEAAVSLGYTECVRVLLENGCSANMRTAGDQQSVLHLAATTGFKNVVSDLLLHGANVNSMDSDKYTPLYCAVMANSYEVVEVLVSSGADIHYKRKDGYTALHLATETADRRIIEFFVANGADPLQEDEKKETPLSRCVRFGDVEKLDAMFQSKRLTKDVRFWNKMTPLHLAAGLSLDVVKYLINRGFEPKPVNDHIKPIHAACIAGKENIVEYFLELGVSVNEPDYVRRTPLHYAAKHSHEDILLQLLIHGAAYNALTDGGSTALSLATDKKIEELLSSIEKCFDLVEKGDVTVETIIKNMGEQDVRYLEALIKTRNRNNQDILTVADVHKYPTLSKLYEICHAYKENVQGLHSRCLDEDTQKSDSVKSGKHKNSGNPMEKQRDVITAAIKGDLDSLKKLLQRGCNVNETDNNGRTALHFAVKLADEKCVQFLLQNGADVTQVSHKGNTALHTAVNKQCVSIVKLLLEFALNNRKMELINTPTLELGNTALHVAAKNGSLIVAKILLKYGAIYEIKNRDGTTPMDLSSNVEVFQFFTLLKEMFADAKTGNFRLVTQMKSMANEDISAVTGARNEGGRTIVQVALGFEHKNITTNLIKLIQAANAN